MEYVYVHILENQLVMYKAFYFNQPFCTVQFRKKSFFDNLLKRFHDMT